MKLLLLSACIGICCFSYSQTDVVKHYELKGQAYSQADSILEVWMKTEYPNILRKNKLKMTCAKCSNIFMDVIINIGDDGRLKNYRVVKTNVCSNGFSKKLENEFISYFATLGFPSTLRGLWVEFRLGTGLKC